MNYFYICVLLLPFVILSMARSKYVDGPSRMFNLEPYGNYSNDLEVHVGDSMLLICPEHDAGSPRAIGDTTWSKQGPNYQVIAIDNTLVIADPRVSLLPDPTSFGFMLVVENLVTLDGGKYQCKVQSDAGLVLSDWYVTVLPASQLEIID